MFCPSCGKEMTGNEKFCPYCGAQFPADFAPENVAGSAPEDAAGSAPEAPEASADPAAPAPDAPAGSAPAAPEIPAAPAPSEPGIPADPALFTPQIPASSAPEAPAGFAAPAPDAPACTVPMGVGSFGASAALADGGKKRPGAGLIIGGVAVVVLLVALAVAAISGLFSSPKSELEKALAKTVGAYADAREGLGLPDLTEFLRYDSYSQRISFALDRVGPAITGYYPEMSSLEGFGMRLDTDFDRESRKMDAGMAFFWNSEDLLSFQILADDNKIYLASPELTQGDAYGLNTETLGADLIMLGVETDEMDISSIGFNLFDLPDPSVYGMLQNGETEETAKANAEAAKQLLDAIEVKKGGKVRIAVNGYDVNATLYRVTVPGDALKDYFNAMADTAEAVDSGAVMEEMLEAMGFDKRTIRETISGMEDANIYGGMADEFRQVANSIGDVELEVYVSDGYVSAVEYSGRVDGKNVEIGLYLGGGDNYVDDWSLEVTVAGDTLTIESSGDHGGKDGVFTDETTIRMDDSRLTSMLRYEPKGAGDNFAWELSVDNTASIEMGGRLAFTDRSMDLQLEELSFRAAGSTLISLKGTYYVGPCEGMQVSFSSPKLLAEMSEGERMNLFLDILNNADAWGYDVMDRMPPELFY